MHKLRKVVQAVDNISESVAMAARWITIVMMVIILINTGGRYIFDSPLFWGHEVNKMLWGFFILCGGLFVLRHDAHVRFDLVYNRLSPRRRAILNSVTLSFFFVYCIAIMWCGVPAAWASFLKDEHYRTLWGPPLWPIRMLVPIAVFLFLVQGSATYMRNLYTAITGRQLT